MCKTSLRRLVSCLFIAATLAGNLQGDDTAGDRRSEAVIDPANGSLAAPVRVDIDETTSNLTVSIGEQTAFVYRFDESLDLPHFDPFNSASGRAMTVKITEPYPHHRSFWVADEGILLEGRPERVGIYNALYSGVIDKSKSPYPVAPYARRVKHVEFTNVSVDGDEAGFDEKLTWFDGETPLLDELRRYRVVSLGEGEYFLDFSFRLRATYGNLSIRRDSSHYAIPYIRMNDHFNVQEGGGQIVNDQGGRQQAETDGKFASWVDYHAPLPDGSGFEGIACFIHPSKRPPHLWLTRDYGTWGPRGSEGHHATTFEIPRGEHYDQRVGLLIHRGDARTGDVAKRYARYSDGDL